MAALHDLRADGCRGRASPVARPSRFPAAARPGEGARRGGLPRTQALSSVLFLCGAAAGAAWGPTLVIEQTPASPPGARAWAAPAAANCLVAFPGSFLHGVLPGAPRAWPALPPQAAHAPGLQRTRAGAWSPPPTGLLHGPCPAQHGPMLPADLPGTAAQLDSCCHSMQPSTVPLWHATPLL